MADAAQDPPDGFEPFTRESPLLEPWRPLLCRAEPDRLVIGLVVREPHCNSRGTVHGGLFAALADQAMGMSSALKLRAAGQKVQNLWTTSMTVDYLGVAKLGQWLEFDTVFSKAGRSNCHAEADIRADGKTVARARAAFRIVLQPPKGEATDE
jgi:uncharacterized protein (TIGR00369 family)